GVGGAEGVLCIDGAACGVGVACGVGGEDEGVKVRVALQRGGDGLQLAGGGVEHIVNLLVDRVERFRERVPLLLSGRPCEEVRVSASGDCAGGDESLNRLVGGRVALCGLDGGCDVGTVGVGDGDGLRSGRDRLGEGQPDL